MSSKEWLDEIEKFANEVPKELRSRVIKKPSLSTDEFIAKMEKILYEKNEPTVKPGNIVVQGLEDQIEHVVEDIPANVVNVSNDEEREKEGESAQDSFFQSLKRKWISFVWVAFCLAAMVYHMEVTSDHYFKYEVTSTTKLVYGMNRTEYAFSFCFPIDRINTLNDSACTQPGNLTNIGNGLLGNQKCINKLFPGIQFPKFSIT